MQLFLEFENVASLASEIERNLSKGRAFVPGQWEVARRQPCQLVLVHPTSSEWLPLDAEIVLAEEGARGVGLELQQPTDDLAQLLEDFLGQRDGPAMAEAQGIGELALTAATDSSDSLILEPVQGPEQTAGPENSASPESVAPSSSLRRSSWPPSSRGGGGQGGPARSPAERVRALDLRGRERCARRGPLADRVALERAYGAQVWESLLSNPQLTGPEVARIAKNRTVSQPILKTIVGMAGWIAKPEVRRALLSNPRLTDAHAERVLRALPLSELKLVPKQAAYPVRVRNVAKRLLPG